MKRGQEKSLSGGSKTVGGHTDGLSSVWISEASRARSPERPWGQGHPQPSLAEQGLKRSVWGPSLHQTPGQALLELSQSHFLLHVGDASF